MPISIVIKRNQVNEFLDSRGVKEHRMVDYKDNGFDKMGDYVRLTFAIGRVVNEREMNGYHDSDFYATYMNDKGVFIEYEYASTRGWSYANGAAIDADEATRAAYKEYLDAIEANRRAAHENGKNQAASACNLSREEYDKLCRVYHGDTLGRVFKLLSTNLRSEFRIKLATQIRDWLKEESPKHSTPLSEKQLYYV